MMPSPLYNPTAWESNRAVGIFISAIIRLIRKYVTEPVLLLRLDALQSVVKEVSLVDTATCALRLGGVQQEEYDGVEICVRVKLAQMLASSLRERNSLLDGNILEMTEEWKRSDIEILRQIGWECE